MKWKDAAGVGQIVSAVHLSRTDLNPALTQATRDQVNRGDLKAAQDAIANAQVIPPIPAHAKDASGQPIQPVKPTLTPGLADGIRNGSTEFFQVFLYDSCAEDGDVVEVMINGAPFATVPLTHGGATLSVPITAGAATDVSLRGIFDGGGGITVACRTSQGDYFSRRMGVGETTQIGLVQK